MKKRILLMTSILAMCVAGVSGCGNSSKATTIPSMEECTSVEDDTVVSEATFKYDTKIDDLEGNYHLVAQNDNYELYLKQDNVSFCVKQKSTGEIFNSAVNTAEHGISDENILPVSLKRFQSPFHMTCINAKQDGASELPGYFTDFTLGGDIKTYEIKEDKKVVGFRAEYPIASLSDATGIDITVKIDYKLTDKGFDVTLPVDCVEENGDYKVTKLTVLPSFAVATNEEDGYFFYPDGSGAIMEFKDSSHKGETSVTYSVYNDLQNYESMLGEWDQEAPEVFVPVFGSSLTNQSFTAIVTAGEETASIVVTPSKGDEKDPFNHIWTTFELRKAFIDPRYVNSDKEIDVFDDEYLNIERTVSYNLFEAGKEADYDDMAVCYRDYLLNDYGLDKKESKTDNIPVSIDFFMGIKEEGLILDEFKAATTFSQVETMLDDLKTGGVDSIETQLKGWTKKGYDTEPENYPVNSDIGGAKGLSSLTSKYKDDDNVKITLQTNLLEAMSDNDGYNMNTDTIVLGNDMVFTDADESVYLLSPNVSKGMFDEMIKNDKKNKSESINGYSFEGIGKYLLYNYNTNNTVNATQSKKIWQDLLKANEDKYNTTIVEGGNQYVLTSADKLTDIPYDDSGYRITTKSVPFYQIALHGIVEFTGEPGNLSSDFNEEKLKWVEYGYMPYFELTYNSSDMLIYTNYNKLFSSEYKTWEDKVKEIYTEFNEQLGDVWNAYIIGHEEVATNVYKVTYDNKKAVYVNYTDKDYKITESNVVEGQSFAVIDE